jgi:hypothetical protein
LGTAALGAMPRRTIAHVGFLVLAISAIGQLALGVTEDLMLRAAEASNDFSSFDRFSKLWYFGWCAVVAAQIAGLVLASRVPRSTGGRGPLVASATLAVLGGLQVFGGDSFWTMANAALSARAMRLLSGSISLLDVASDALLVVGAWMVGAWRPLPDFGPSMAAGAPSTAGSSQLPRR